MKRFIQFLSNKDLIIFFFGFRESIEEHCLTVMVKDQGTPSKRNYARIIIRVHDHNDHSPEFVSPIIQGKVFETSDIGTAVARVVAIDRDRDDNAKITYSIISGKFKFLLECIDSSKLSEGCAKGWELVLVWQNSRMSLTVELKASSKILIATVILCLLKVFKDLIQASNSRTELN